MFKEPNTFKEAIHGNMILGIILIWQTGYKLVDHGTDKPKNNLYHFLHQGKIQTKYNNPGMLQLPTFCIQPFSAFHVFIALLHVSQSNELSIRRC